MIKKGCVWLRQITVDKVTASLCGQMMTFDTAEDANRFFRVFYPSVHVFMVRMKPMLGSNTGTVLFVFDDDEEFTHFKLKYE